MYLFTGHEDSILCKHSYLHLVACASSILIPYMCFYAAVIKTVIMVIDMMSANVSFKGFLDLLYNYVVSLITRVITVVLFHSLLKCMGLGFNFTDALVTWCAGSLESVAPCAASVNGGSPTCSSTCDLRSTSTRSSSVCTASLDCSAHSCKICACGVSFEGRQTDSSCSHDVQGSSLSGYEEGSSAECRHDCNRKSCGVPVAIDNADHTPVNPAMLE